MASGPGRVGRGDVVAVLMNDYEETLTEERRLVNR